MRYLIITLCLLVAGAAAVAGAYWQRSQDRELSPSEYAALYSLKRMDPALFKEKILPELEKALADNRLTHGELRAIEARVGSLGASFLKAATSRSFDDQLSESLSEAEKKARETGRNLGDAFGKALDEAMGYMQRKSEEFSKQSPPQTEPPAKL